MGSKIEMENEFTKRYVLLLKNEFNSELLRSFDIRLSYNKKSRDNVNWINSKYCLEIDVNTEFSIRDFVNHLNYIELPNKSEIRYLKYSDITELSDSKKLIEGFPSCIGKGSVLDPKVEYFNSPFYFSSLTKDKTSKLKDFDDITIIVEGECGTDFEEFDISYFYRRFGNNRFPKRNTITIEGNKSIEKWFDKLLEVYPIKLDCKELKLIESNIQNYLDFK